MFEKLKEILMEEFRIPEDKITMDAELINDLGINSLDLNDLALQCEDKFDIEIRDEDIRQFITVGNVVEYLDKINLK